MKKIVIVSLLAMWLTACGSGLDGTYADENGIYHYVFEPNGKVKIREQGQLREYDYQLDGDLVLIELSEENQEILVQNDDGSLSPKGITNVNLLKQ